MAKRTTGAAEAGKQALAALRRTVADRLVDALDERDPELLASLSEIGIVRRGLIEDGSGPMTAPTVEVVQHVLELAAERRPSVLTSLGLSAVQLLSQPAAGAVRPSEHGAIQRVAVMFTDLEGFTRYTARQGDEAASALLSAHHRAVGPVLRSRGGRVVKRLGDGLLLTFPEPEAAVLAGLELVDSAPEPLRLRGGVHVGDVLALPDDVIGHVVNVAARVTELARGGEVMVTVDVRDAIGAELGRVRFSRVRRRSLKGIDTAVGVCRAHPA